MTIFIHGSGSTPQIVYEIIHDRSWGDKSCKRGSLHVLHRVLQRTRDCCEGFNRNYIFFLSGVMMDRPYVHVACSRRLDSGEQVKSYAASAKRNTRGKKLGETGALFFPRQFFARSPPSERLEQANVHPNFLQVWNVMRLHHPSNRGGRGLGGTSFWLFSGPVRKA